MYLNGVCVVSIYSWVGALVPPPKQFSHSIVSCLQTADEDALTAQKATISAR